MHKDIKLSIKKSNLNEYLGKNKLVNKIAPLVSVKVETYQHVNYIKECLDSILMQKTNFPIEIIIGEDESVDGTREICMQYAKENPDKIRLFLRERKYSANLDDIPDGCFNAWANIEASSGKYIAWCEGDDYWTDPLKLQKQFEFMEANPDCTMSFHAANTVNKNGDIIAVRAPSPINTKYGPEEMIVRSGAFFATASLMYLSSIAKNLPYFARIAMSGDYSIGILFASHGNVGYIAQIMAVYRRGVSGSWSATVRTDKDSFTRHLYDTFTMLGYYDSYTRSNFSSAVSIRKRKLIKKILKANNCDENEVSSLLNTSINLTYKEKIKILANWYKPLISRNIYNYFRKKPVGIYKLLQFGDIAFEEMKWKESIEWYTCLQNNLPDNNIELWLKSNQNIVSAYLELNKNDKVKKQKLLALKKMGGKKDVLKIVKDYSGDISSDIKLNTKLLSRSKNNIYVCLHSAIVDNNKTLMKLVEKCLHAGSREPLIYETIRDNKIFKTTKYAKTAQIKKIIYAKEFTRLFIKYINNLKFEFDKIDLYNLGFALGEIAIEFNALMPEYAFKMKPLEVFDQRIMDKLFSLDRDEFGGFKMPSNLLRKDNTLTTMEAKTIFKQLENFYSQKNKIEAVVENIPKVFSHNNVTKSNIILEENKPELYFVGWRKASYNCVGSDIGSILRWNVFEKAEIKGRADDIEAEIVRGYTSKTNNYFQYSVDDLTFSYNLNFINSTIDNAIFKNDMLLMKRIADRSKTVLETAGF